LALALVVAGPCLPGAGVQAGDDRTGNGGTYTPSVGQQGKDVVWVPTPSALVEKMLDLAAVGPADRVFDLGSGDGRTVIAAARRGASALGVEYDPDMVALSKQKAAKAGVSDKAEFVREDLYGVALSPATVITMFLLPEINLKLRPRILDLRPGTRIVSNTFTMGEWAADKGTTVGEENGCVFYCTAYLWVVPAKVKGNWRMGKGELSLAQTFQEVSGTMRSGGKTLPLTEGRVEGTRIGFVAGDIRYAGTVDGNVMKGTSGSGLKKKQWSATRSGDPVASGDREPAAR
jgi:SAM-dependent methyltransferase